MSGNTRQSFQLYHGYAFGRRQIHVEIAHDIQPIEMNPEIRLAALQGTSSQNPQTIELARILRKQAGNLITLRFTQTTCDARPKPGCRAVSYAPNEPLQYRQAWQKDVVRHQPVRGLQHQRSRPVIAHPAFQIEPSRQPHSQLWGIGVVDEPMACADGANMPLNGLGGAEIGLQRSLCIDGKLSAQIGCDDRRNVMLRRGERPYISSASQQSSISETVLGRPQIANIAQVGPVQCEGFHQVIIRQGLRQPSKPRALRGRQKSGWHSVRNSQVLRHRSATREIKDKSFAKHMCEKSCFSNMIRTLLETAA